MPGAATRNRIRVPSWTPAGTRRLTAWKPARSPMPRAVGAPVAPDFAAAAALGAGAPDRHAERDDRAPERFTRRDDDVGAGLEAAGPPKNEWRMLSSTVSTDGKSTSTSSARQSATEHDSSSPEMSGMIAARELAVGPLDLVRARVARHAEDVVVVAHV